MKLGNSLEVGEGGLDEGRAQGGLERHRMIAGVTKASRSKLVEQATWEKDVGPGRSFSFLEKDRWAGTLDKGKILQAEELTANRWKAGIRKCRSSDDPS